MEYLNEFHKETTERKLKSIAEMKKLPSDYEKEYERHKKMKEDAIKAEKNLEQSNQTNPVSSEKQAISTNPDTFYRQYITDPEEREFLQQASKLMPNSLRLKIKKHLES